MTKYNKCNLLMLFTEYASWASCAAADTGAADVRRVVEVSLSLLSLFFEPLAKVLVILYVSCQKSSTWA